jgi:hypothetical protein
MKQRLRILWLTAILLFIIAVSGHLYSVLCYVKGVKAFYGISILSNLCAVIWIFVMITLLKESKKKL